MRTAEQCYKDKDIKGGTSSIPEIAAQLCIAEAINNLAESTNKLGDDVDRGLWKIAESIQETKDGLQKLVLLIATAIESKEK